MPYEIAIVNPRKVKKMAKRKKGVMPTGLKAYWAKHRAKKKNPRKKRRSNPAPARAPASYKHKKTKRKVASHMRWVNPRRKRSHNPRFLSGLTSHLMPVALGAGGAVALDVALGYIPLPAQLQTGLARQAVRAAAAVALGWGAGKVLGKSKGAAITQGALTVIAYDVVKSLLHKTAPALPGLAGDFEEVDLGYLNPAPLLQDDTGAGAYMDDGVGAYMDDGVGDF